MDSVVSIKPEDGNPFEVFKDDQGRLRTASLFKEKREASKYPSYFTLKPGAAPVGHVSMHDKYMEISDPTEYQVAMTLLGSWDHWQRLCAAKWFKPHVEAWREELRIKRHSASINTLEEFATQKDHIGYAATKALLDMNAPPKVKGAGRPLKKEAPETIEALDQRQKDWIDEDAKRLGLL